MAEKALANLRLTMFSDPESLQEPELLALLMGATNRLATGVEIARALLEKSGSVGELLQNARNAAFLKEHDLSQVPGSRLAALSEIVRRLGESGGRAGSRAQSLDRHVVAGLSFHGLRDAGSRDRAAPADSPPDPRDRGADASLARLRQGDALRGAAQPPHRPRGRSRRSGVLDRERAEWRKDCAAWVIHQILGLGRPDLARIVLRCLLEDGVLEDLFATRKAHRESDFELPVEESFRWLEPFHRTVCEQLDAADPGRLDAV